MCEGGDLLVTKDRMKSDARVSHRKERVNKRKMNRKPQQFTQQSSQQFKLPPANEARHLDDQCEGDVEWEQRMKRLNPTWRRTDYSLWDVYHE